jgi:hypothetical protein
MKVFLIIGAAIALIDLVVVVATMKASSHASRMEETARLKRLSAEEGE